MGEVRFFAKRTPGISEGAEPHIYGFRVFRTSDIRTNRRIERDFSFLIHPNFRIPMAFDIDAVRTSVGLACEPHT